MIYMGFLTVLARCWGRCFRRPGFLVLLGTLLGTLLGILMGIWWWNKVVEQGVMLGGGAGWWNKGWNKGRCLVVARGVEQRVMLGGDVAGDVDGIHELWVL